MGVYGLWRLINATGKPVPLETLEGKVLAVDVSIWIHQVMQGYQDRHGNPKPNAHLLGLFNRICKLLYYKIKPVFVFDGGVPMLKKNTIASRRKQKSIATSKAQKMKADLINNLIRHTAVKSALTTKPSNEGPSVPQIGSNLQSKPTVNDMFKLPELPAATKIEPDLSDDYDSDSSVQLSPRKQTKWMGNIHNVDVASTEFKSLPADVRYDILTDLKETRKQNSWGRLHEMPEESHAFSGFQMQRLLKRRLVQECLESAEKEMGGKTLTIEELEKLLTEQGIDTKRNDAAYRIAADSVTRLIYISDKNALPKATEDQKPSKESDSGNESGTKDPVPGPSTDVPILENMDEYALDDEWDSEVELITSHINAQNRAERDTDSDAESMLNESRPLSKKYFGKSVMNPALTYMLEYSGLTDKQILQLLEQNRAETPKKPRSKSKSPQVCLSNAEISEKQDAKVEEKLASVPEETMEHSESGDMEVVETIDSNEKTVNTSPKRKPLECELKFDDLKAKIANDSVKPVNEIEVSENEEVSMESVTEQKSPKPSSARGSDTESDSDDFIEIQDVPIPETNNITKCEKKEGFQITIKSDAQMQDDMFADVFRDVPSSSSKLVKLGSKIETRTELPKLPRDSETFIKETTDVSSKPEEETDAGSMKPEDERSGLMETGSQLLDDKFEKEKAQMLDADEDIFMSSELNVESQIIEKPIEPPLPLDEEELLSLKARLEEEQEDLAANIGKLERQATDISDQIRVEAQELLRLFGIPYVVAPMEAEAQCAYLEQIRLTNGTITDDSDIWLFGGQCVYKNFFNNNKRVLQFLSCDIQHHFKLTRNEMIQLALLVGSDYTTGLSGIGPVTALEVLAAFPAAGDNLLHGLTNFCSWIRGNRIVGPGKAALRNKLKNVQIEKGFPSQAVVQAYLFPTIDESKEGFTWGKPNVVLLCDYTRRKLGWTKAKFDEVMNPVIKRMEQKKSQKTIDSYFKVHKVPKSIEQCLSKRVQKAVHLLNNENIEEEFNATEDQPKSKQGKTKAAVEKRKKRNPNDEANSTATDTRPDVHVVVNTGEKKVEEYIPQREKDKAEALKKKLHAIEVIRKSKQGLCKTKKVKRCVRKVKKEAELSESDSD